MKTPPFFVRRNWITGTLLAALCTGATAMFVPPEPTPVDRVLKNTETFLAKNPDRADAHYTLGRTHYLAFHLKRDEVPAFRHHEKGDSVPRLAPQWMLEWGEKKNSGKEIPKEDLVKHAASAMKAFREALRLAPTDQQSGRMDGLIQLGIASLQEEFAEWNKAAKVANLPPELAGIDVATVRAAYAKALKLAMPTDSKLTDLPLAGIRDIVSHEAATALVRLAKDQSAKLTEAEQADVKQAEKAVEHCKTLKTSIVTPIVFSFQPAAHLDALLAPDTVVNFDLRGYGPRERWPWVKPELGFLVWDPERTGIVRSARQLFGGYTFQIFRANGYDALAALDDDSDGVLSGAELDGISVWFDRNSDGVSSPAEVTPLRDLGIVSVAVTVDGHDGIHPTNPRGITCRDGRTLPTWDWLVEPVKEAPARLAAAPGRGTK